ncbi:hypothetical protein EDC30_101213 [Paucimonas lemoignei]|uniref:Uncharacterized protein n=1 Tax=Paucimonas lemoignei TaxID=29443 RepID=A0A4R3I128_PAULE|nr:hypothetical protein [Paucimonas lemoignei]TCS39258.1 hypothetical protein EDC30_101213 [Paucimonas lemoignei]
MPYTFSKRSYEQDLFDAVKARLKTPVRDYLALSEQWPGVLDYGLPKPLLSKWAKFRSASGSLLHARSIPLCTSSPALITSLSHKPAELPPQIDAEAAFAEQVAAMLASEAHGNLNSVGDPQVPEEPLLDEESDADAKAGVERKSARISIPRIPTAVLSTFLSVAAAVAGGLIIANGNSFKFGHDAATRPQDVGISMQADSTAASEPDAARLAMDTRLPQASLSSSDVSEPGNSVQPAYTKKREHSEKRVIKTEKKMRTVDTETRASKRIASVVPAKKTEKTAQRSKSNASQSTASHAAPIVTAKSDSALHAGKSSSSPGTQYARCESVKGLLRRERCKWDACSGKWGKQGCPAYQHNARPELGYGQIGRLGQFVPAGANRTQDGG